MSSWREAASAQSQKDLDDLLSLVLPFAQQELEKHGEFYPFGAWIDLSGEAGLLMINELRPEARTSAILEECVSALQTRRNQIRAAATVSDVRLPEVDCHAVAVDLEHNEGQAIAVLLPYRHRPFKALQYLALRAEPGRRRIWKVPD